MAFCKNTLWDFNAPISAGGKTVFLPCIIVVRVSLCVSWIVVGA